MTHPNPNAGVPLRSPYERDLTDTRNVPCPRCGFPVFLVDDTDGDGFVTCACGASVDLDAVKKVTPSEVNSRAAAAGE